MVHGGVAAGVTVQPVPAAHPYVQRATGCEGVVLLADPAVPGAAPGVWWPPEVLRPTWPRSAGVDLVHVHFGFEQVDLGALRAWQHARQQAGVGLVVTVHDLVNPHHGDDALHRAQLRVLLEGADAVLTLTGGAAREIRGRFGVHALVVAHPYVVELDRMRHARPATDVVGLDLKGLRANTDAIGPTRELLAWASADRPVQISVHAAALASRPDVRAVLAGASDRPGVEVLVHERRDDAELWDHLQGLAVAVLPYAWGTHSGWLEACWDLGTAVVAPAQGFYAEQRPGVVPYRPGGLAHALQTALATRGPDQETRVMQRQEQLSTVLAQHAAVYAWVARRGRVAA